MGFNDICGGSKFRGPVVGRLKRRKREERRDARLRAMQMPWWREGLHECSDARWWVWRADVNS